MDSHLNRIRKKYKNMFCFFFPVGAVMHVSMSGDYKMNMHHDILFHKDDLGLMRFAP